MSNKKIEFRRSGDVNFHPITEAEFNKVKGEIVKHNSSFVVARGEATNSEHRITVKNKENLIIKKDTQGNFYFSVMEEAELTHTHDHNTTKTPKKVFYKQVQERELDHFAGSVARKVVD